MIRKKSLKELEYQLECWKGELEHSYRREHKIAPSWLYERIHRLEETIRWRKKGEIE